MTQKQVKQIVFAAQNFGSDYASQLAKLFRVSNDLDSLIEKSNANSEAFQAECKQDMEEIEAH